MKSSYNLLFNNLWCARGERTNKLNPQLLLGHDFLKNSATNQLISQSKSMPLANQIINTVHLSNIIPNMVLNNNKPEIALATTNSQQCVAIHPINVVTNKSGATGDLFTDWTELVTSITACKKCSLCDKRTQVVIERGNRSAKWMFVGEGPGEEEDLQGLPFVGASGQLLNKMISAMNLNHTTDVYVCNVVKCRPPGNLNPDKAEMDACNNYLLSQISLVKPQIIIALGRNACQMLLATNMATAKLRGTVHKLGDIPLVVTYHPAYLLRNPDAKKDAWADLQLALQVCNNKYGKSIN